MRGRKDKWVDERNSDEKKRMRERNDSAEFGSIYNCYQLVPVGYEAMHDEEALQCKNRRQQCAEAVVLTRHEVPIPWAFHGSSFFFKLSIKVCFA